jgi:hypothetical protein
LAGFLKRLSATLEARTRTMALRSAVGQEETLEVPSQEIDCKVSYRVRFQLPKRQVDVFGGL